VLLLAMALLLPLGAALVLARRRRPGAAAGRQTGAVTTS
jgi:hypothetical protein